MAFDYAKSDKVYYHNDNPNLAKGAPLFVLPSDIDTYFLVIGYS